MFILGVVGLFVSNIAKWLAGKTRPENDLLCVEWDVKLYSPSDWDIFTLSASWACVARFVARVYNLWTYAQHYALQILLFSKYKD